MREIKARILIVEDEPRYVQAIKVNLETSGYETLVAENGIRALEMVALEEVDLILLDIRLPGIDGFEVCKRIRKFSSVPIIMITARVDEVDKVKGLDEGADDYVTKPFSAKELLARVRAVLRRARLTRRHETQPVFKIGELTVDFMRKRVYRGDEEVELSATEYEVLCEMVKNAGRVLVPEHLLERVWGSEYVDQRQLLWQIIHRLRSKIEPDPQNPQYIVTRPGIGYVFGG
ncbi:MAG: response regulator transcription factor [Anaerolineae bacterium]